ncbi:MAG TPA: hypothetical protein DEF51_05410, partial [Myxococcales bacterium]|nr:hypothetical protein [Myxococcales bacterium]
GACGEACDGSQLCDRGACTCPGGGARCHGRCVDLDDDPAHCGGCGLACPFGVPCVDGACACPDGGVLCDG